jgi:amino acid adenylation domain-containing protein/non-ribosomal peptide synthase protein (TIGR01720 family)
MRVHLFSISESDHVFLLTIHHIACDAWSIWVLQDELRLLYAGEESGKRVALPPLATSYADYVRWQTEMLESQAGQRHWSFWREQLTGELPVLDLRSDRHRPTAPTYRGSTIPLRIPEELTEQLALLARTEGATLYVVLLAAFQALLHRYTDQRDILVGCPASGRTRSEFGGVVGYFVNPLVMRADLSGNPPFREFLAQVRRRVLAALAHQDYPFPVLVERLNPKRDPSRSPLFQVAFVFQKPQRLGDTATLYAAAKTEARLDVGGLTVEPFELHQQEGQFDLTLEMIEAEGSLRGLFKYSTDLFERETISCMADHFRNILQAIARTPDQRLQHLPLLSQRDREKLLVEWNTTHVDFPEDPCIHESFEAQVRASPDRPAVSSRGRQLTYRQLNERSNQLAHYLRKHGVGPEVLVGICAERSVEMVVAILGVLKAGGAYVPLDPEYPRERLAFMLDDTRAPVVLAHRRVTGSLPAFSGRVLLLDTDWDEIAQECTENPDRTITAENLAYVIYTSGSSGRPKGVAIAHRSAAALIAWAKTRFGPEDLRGVLASTSICFDLSVFELFVTLSTGGKVLIVENVLELQTMDPLDEITLVNTVPSAIAELLRNGGLPRSVRTVNLAGEPLSTELADLVYGAGNVARVFDLYGPTEDTTYSTCALRTRGGPATIGRPIANTQIYLLDNHLQPVPRGVPGELYIGGAGLAQGYLNLPQLTAERFIPNLFSADPSSRLYRTGDLARYLPDGNLEFLGRTDHQVKIRGYRIELGEIESALIQHPAVEEAAVVPRDDHQGQKRLVAYAVPCEGDRTSVEDLRRFLGGKLPNFMVPSLFLTLDALPRTPNGKLDRRALPATDGSRPHLEKKYVAPRNPTEEVLRRIWCDLLGLERAGVFDNFFELGGDSILGIQMVSRARAAGLRCSPTELLQNQTIAGLAAVVGAARKIVAQQGEVSGPVGLTPIQQWLFEQARSHPECFNQWLLLEVRPGVDPAPLGKAVNELEIRHDALRLRFHRQGDQWQATNAPVTKGSVFAEVDLSDLPHAEQDAAMDTRGTEVQKSLRLEDGPLLRSVYFNLGTHRPARLLLTVHHLVVDGVSWRILLEDIHRVYWQLERDEPIQKVPKTTSFQEWSRRLAQFSESSQAAREGSYWTSRRGPSAQPIPLDFDNGVNTVASAETVVQKLEPDQTNAVLGEIHKAYRTRIDEILLTALASAYRRWSGQTRLLLDLESHGRQQLWEDIDLSRTVGWFTSLYPILLETEESSGPGEAIKSIKEQLREVPSHGISYGALRYLSDGEIAVRLMAQPRPSVVFNYLGQLDRGLDHSSSLFVGVGLARGLYQSPEARRAHAVEINAYVAHDRLHVEWTYSRALHRPESIESWASEFMRSLGELIKHCQDPESGGYTPSDFPAARISQKDLQAVLAKIQRKEGETPP